MIELSRDVQGNLFGLGYITRAHRQALSVCPALIITLIPYAAKIPRESSKEDTDDEHTDWHVAHD